MHDLVLLYEVNFRHPPYLFDDVLSELSSVTFEVPVVNVTEALCRLVTEERVIGVSHLEEVEVVLHNSLRKVITKNDDIRVVNGSVWMLRGH
jgi:hypothetical protein